MDDVVSSYIVVYVDYFRVCVRQVMATTEQTSWATS